jgi:replicative DNA helicase
MDIKEIKARYSEQIMEAMTDKDGSGRGYVCPICGAGTGQHGTGLFPVPKNKGYYKCFAAGCEFYGDVLELVGQVYHLQDTAQQIRKAGELIGVNFTEDKTQWFNEPEPGTEQGNPDKNTVQTNDETKPGTAAVREYMAAAAANFKNGGAQYFQARGIPPELAEKYGAGFVARYGDGMNAPAVIIPTGYASYTARATTTDDKARKVRKRTADARQGIFGMAAMKEKPPLAFIVEGELDAMSILAAGFPAVATGGGTSKREIVEELKRRGSLDTFYFVLPDNDRLPNGSPDMTRGIAAGKSLTEALTAAGFRATLVDVLDGTWPQDVKDANEFLMTDRDGFHSFLQGIKAATEEKILNRVSGYMPDFVKQIAGNTPPIPTGFPLLDKYLEGGLHPGLVILGAISSLGKTTFTLNIADTLAAAGYDVLFYSLEMSRFELISKIISRRTALYCLTNKKPLTLAKTNLGVSDFKRYQSYSTEEKTLLQTCMNEFAEGAAQNLYIREGLQDIGTEQIRQDIKTHLFFTGRRPVVIVDYVQILKTPDVHFTDKQKTDANVVDLKRISRDFNLPIVGISSFNRDNYREPVNMAAFKESGALEYTSDVLIGLQYDGMDYMEGDTEKKRTERIRELFKENELNARQGKAIPIQCKILKNRSGGKTSGAFDYFPMFNLYLESFG